ncbi:MAG: response regulator transcription factor [Chloroflexi bacterium]|nr:response regulator transcription factor [Chloroflexota bacterium]
MDERMETGQRRNLMANPTTTTHGHTGESQGIPSLATPLRATPPGQALPVSLRLDERVGRLLRLAQSTTGASTAALLLHSPEEGRITFLTGNPPATIAVAPLASALPLLCWAAANGPCGTPWAQAEDLPQSQALPQQFLRLLQEVRPQHLLPLLEESQPLGGVLLGPTESGAPPAPEALEQLAQSLAHAAPSIEDARLYAFKEAEAAELRRRLQEQEERAALAGQRLLDASTALRAATGQGEEGPFGAFLKEKGPDGQLPDDGSAQGLGEALLERAAALERLASELDPGSSQPPYEEKALPRTPQAPLSVHEATSPEVVVISASAEVAQAVALCLRVRWPACAVKAASGMGEGLSLLKQGAFDLVFLDAASQATGPFHLCQEVRLASSVPLVLLGAGSHEAAESQALEAGADAYLSKPFGYRLLLAKAEAVLRHSPQQASTAFAFPGLFLDIPRREATVRGRKVRLTATEAKLLQHLTQGHGRVVLARELLVKVWGQEYANASYLLKVHIQHLRRKLEEDPRMPRIILTQRGQGYRIVPPVEGQGATPSPATQPLLLPLE